MSIYMSAASFLLEEWSSCKVVTHGERVPPNVRALVVINHVSDIDGIAGLAWFARMPPPFPGCVKAIVKERYVRAGGWAGGTRAPRWLRLRLFVFRIPLFLLVVVVRWTDIH